MISDLPKRAEAPFSAWQQGIVFEAKRYKHRKDEGASVREAVRKRQQVLERAAGAGPRALAGYLREQLDVGPRDRIGAPALPRALTPNEYLNPPLPLEREVGTAWSGRSDNGKQQPVTAREASQPVFWLLCHIEWIEQHRFGRRNLAEVFLNGPGRPDLEGRTRNLLRRTGGIFVRGRTSVFSDCTLARAWWRHRLAQEVARATNDGIPASHAHAVLHANRPAWETLVMLSLRRLVVINEPLARAAIVRELSALLRTDGRIDKGQVQRMAGALARLGLRNSLAHVPEAELAGVAKRALQ